MNKLFYNKVLDAKRFLSYNVQELGFLESSLFRKKVLLDYTTKADCYPIWENLQSKISVCEKDSWKWLDEFIQYQKVFLFFEESDDPIVYVIDENQSIVDFLAEIPFVFYLTNEQMSFLITQNDHDYLIAAGTAEPWLRNKAIELSKTGWKDADGFYWDENGTKLR